jgi:hypothetical protein
MYKVRCQLERGYDFFGSDSYNTPEFNEFFELFKRSFGKELKKIGATDFVFSKGHFYLSGFFTVNEQPYYFSISDVRDGCLQPKLLVRTAKDYKDYTGGGNMYVIIQSGMYKDLAVKCGLNLKDLPEIKYQKRNKKTIADYVDDILNLKNTGKTNIKLHQVLSMKKANDIAWKLANKFGLPSQTITINKYGRCLSHSRMENDKFKTYYNYGAKELLITFL